MTSTPSTPQIEDEDTFPTPWHVIDSIYTIECRQLSLDTWQLRSPTHEITVNKEGFELYKEGIVENFEKWLDDHFVEQVPRDGK